MYSSAKRCPLAQYQGKNIFFGQRISQKYLFRALHALSKQESFLHYNFNAYFWRLLYHYMIELSWTASIILIVGVTLTYYLYKFVVKPLSLRRFYQSILQTKYKVYFEPFNPLIPGYLARLFTDVDKYGDSNYTYKSIIRDYQLRLTFFKDKVFIELVDPQLIREFYEKHNEGYYVKYTSDMFVTAFNFITGNGLLFAEGSQWKMKRKIMSTVFNFDFIKSKTKTISTIAKQVLDKVEQSPQNVGKNQIKHELDITLQEIFGNVVMKFFFGDMELEDINGESVFQFFNRMSVQNMGRALTLYSVLVGPKFIDYNLRPIDRKINKMYHQFNSYAEKKIKKQLQLQSKNTQKQDSSAKAQTKGVIELVIRQKLLSDGKEGTSAGRQSYNTQDLIDEFKTFFLAGNETTANNISIVLYQLAKNKPIQSRVRQEIEAVIGEDLENITYEQLKELKYLDKCQKEVLRMFPPAPIILNREAVRDHFLGSVPIKAGTLVSVGINANHFKTEFYQNPEVFNPDRWDTIDLKKADPFSFFPFSSGQRNCIGQHLALIQGKIAVAHILKRYNQIRLQKPEFRYTFKTTYSAQRMVTTFVK